MFTTSQQSLEKIYDGTSFNHVTLRSDGNWEYHYNNYLQILENVP